MHVGPSRNHTAWNTALHEGNDAVLAQLLEQEPPGVSLYQLASYINGLYRWTQLPIGQVLGFRTEDAHTRVARVLPAVRAIRSRLGWRQREFDIALMRSIRRSSALSVVIGAGVTQAAGGPSWSELVRLLLEVALNRGHEVTEMALISESPPGSPVRKETYERRLVRVERFQPEDEAEARSILRQINEQGTGTDTEELMRGAQLCYDLFGQHLFTHLTQIIYSHAREPGPVHRAIAELAHGQKVPTRGSGTFAGWDSIVTYNFDALMSEALSEQQVPHAAWAMRAGHIVGDPDILAQKSSWHQRILHLHGYTPRRPFLITNVDFVFSTAQYLRIYSDQPKGIIDAALGDFLASPKHVALYIGCSFNDEAMNDLLREAARRYPGRLHYALLRWPLPSGDRKPTSEEIEEKSKRYLNIGIQPVWIYDYAEIPGIIRDLK